MTTVLPAKTQYENAPAGSHLAICYGVIGLGTQLFKSKQFGDDKCLGILFQFELPNEPMQDGRPFQLNKILKLKSGKKAAFRSFLEAWRGVPFSDSDFGTFDAVRVLGKPALLNISHSTTETGTYANIAAIMQPMKGTVVPDPHNRLVHFSLGKFDQVVYDSLPEWIRAKIALSPEYQELKQVAQNEPLFDENPAPLNEDEIAF